MTDSELEKLRYPVGRFEPSGPSTPEERTGLVDAMAALPGRLREAVSGLGAEQLDTPYRPDGWTVRQVVHHVPDSHLNGYVRLKLAATEEAPTISLYDQAAWAELTDSRSAPIERSLTLLDALHVRWTGWLRTLEGPDWDRTFEHPESGPVSIDVGLQLYAWHGRHHLGHVTGLKERRGW